MVLTLGTLQVDIRTLRYFYIEDDGGSPLVTPVQPELRAAQHKIVKHLEKAYGIKAKKVIEYKVFCNAQCLAMSLVSVVAGHEVSWMWMKYE